MATEIPHQALENYEAVIEKGEKLFRLLKSFEVTQHTSSTLSSCGYAIDSGRLRLNTQNRVQEKLYQCGLLNKPTCVSYGRNNGRRASHDDIMSLGNSESLCRVVASSF